MPRPSFDDVVLVTGFPSYFARRFVQHLLAEEKGTFLYAVVLPKLEAEAKEAMDALPAEARARVSLLSGDAAAMDLGLSGAEFGTLAREVDRIHHCAHASRANTSRELAEALNVGGVAEVVELARAAPNLRSLVVHSTALVSGDRTGVIYEDDLDRGQGFRSVIEETRMRGEIVARRAMPRLPISVVRPTTIVGESDRGALDRFDGVYLLVLLMLAAPPELALPLPVLGDAPLNIVPVDYVVRASHAIGRHPDAPGKTFHLADRHPLSAKRAFDVVSRAAGPRGGGALVPSALAKALLRTPGIERILRRPRAFASELAISVRYDARNTEQLLAGTGLRCPPLESYVDQVVAVVKEHVRRLSERRAARGEPVEAEVDDPLG